VEENELYWRGDGASKGEVMVEMLCSLDIILRRGWPRLGLGDSSVKLFSAQDPLKLTCSICQTRFSSRILSAALRLRRQLRPCT
jgi:hypothetical protein